MSRVTIYRDLALLHTGIFLVLWETLATPPPFDLTVAGLVAGFMGVPVTQALDRARLSKRGVA